MNKKFPRDSRRRTTAGPTKELQRYAVTAASAAAAVVGGTAAVEAAIISSGSISLAASNPLTLNLTTGSSSGATVSSWTFNGGGAYTAANIMTSNVLTSPNSFVVTGVYASNLALNTVIGSSSNFKTGGAGSGGSYLNGTYYSNPVGNFNGTSGYIGIKFLNSVTSQTNYGWIAYTGGTDSAGTITGWGYDDSGAAIAAGAVAVPEPSALALLAAGSLAGTAAVTAKRWRKRKLAA